MHRRTFHTPSRMTPPCMAATPACPSSCSSTASVICTAYRVVAWIRSTTPRCSPCLLLDDACGHRAAHRRNARPQQQCGFVLYRGQAHGDGSTESDRRRRPALEGAGATEGVAANLGLLRAPPPLCETCAERRRGNHSMVGPPPLATGDFATIHRAGRAEKERLGFNCRKSPI